ncbi:MAG: cytochrome c precursor, partial [Gammaproteobacteria bacterium]|nr:cytochrome c precursor [Gammaproteobacteria bacterium]
MRRGFIPLVRVSRLTGLMLLSALSLAAGAATDSTELDPAKVERGRYLISISGCNDCHTRGFAESSGNVPESKWLSGDSLGWKGPWGTTYPSNLRRLLASLSEDQWVHFARNMKSR